VSIAIVKAFLREIFQVPSNICVLGEMGSTYKILFSEPRKGTCLCERHLMYR